MTKTKNAVHRCAWADNDPLMRAYHDEEWGVPERDSRVLWEALMLDGFQAGSGQSQSSFSGQQPSANTHGSPDGSSASAGQSQDDTRQARQERHPNQETRHDQDLAPRNRRGAVYL